MPTILQDLQVYHHKRKGQQGGQKGGEKGFRLFFGIKMGGVMSYWTNQSPYNATSDQNTGDRLPIGLQRELMPEHLAVILDGNRRWAKKRGLTPIEGYQAGIVAMKNFVAMCVKLDIPLVSLFMFSSENWRRPKVSF